VSINGANRLGSNSLPEILVFGARAGKAAAEYVTTAPEMQSAAIEVQALDERRPLEQQFLRKSGGTERVATLREEMQKAAEAGVGIYRTESSLREAAEKLAELQQRAENLALDDHSRTFNTEILSALELHAMLDVATSIVHSALHRTESRGAHQRTDYPARDDRNFLAHSMITRTSDGSVRTDYQPVVITRWPPGERVYGQQPAHIAAKAS